MKVVSALATVDFRIGSIARERNALIVAGRPDDSIPTQVTVRPQDILELLAALLMRLIAERQLSVTQTVQDWLLLRLPRSPAALCEVVARLDRESLVSGTAITRPLAARILKDFPIVDSWDSSMPDVAPSSSARGFL